MATKISGIKGINISKASVLKDGSKKTNTNDSFRDTSNGTTRDNSNNPSALDAAMIKMLLGNTELMAKKAEEIEANMKRREREEERREQENTRREIERIKREEERERNKNEYQEKRAYGKFEGYYKNVNNGIVNSLLSGLVGPAGVLLGKGLNAAGLPLEELTKRGIFKAGRGIRNLFTGRRNINEYSENNNALDINKREMAAKPINDFRIEVSSKLDTIIHLLGGGKGKKSEGDNEKSEKKKSWLGRLLDKYLPIGWLGKLLRFFGKKLPYIAGIGAMGYGFHKLWDYVKNKYGEHLANGAVSGAAQTTKAVLGGIGKGLEKTAETLNIFKKGVLATKTTGATAKILNKLASGGKIGNFLFGKAAANATKTARAASIARASGKLNGAGKALLGAGKTVSKLGKAAGVVGNVVVAGEAGFDAYNKFKAGDKRGGYGAIGRGAGAIAGGALGTWGGAAAGAAIGSVIPVVGTAIGGLIGGILGSFGGSWLGSKGGEALGKAGYDLATGQTKTEGQYTTENTKNYESLQLQNNAVSTQNEILNTLRQIEYNLNPTTQKELDKSYLDNAQRMFDTPPEPIDIFNNNMGGFGMSLTGNEGLFK